MSEKPVPEAKRKRVSLEEGLLEFFQSNGLGIGTLDIFCLGGGNAYRRVRMIFHLLLGFQDKGGRSPIAQFLIILTPNQADAAGDINVLQNTMVEAVRANGRLRDFQQAGEHVRIVVPVDLQFTTVHAIVGEAPRGAVVIICDAASFRSEEIQRYKASELAGAPSLREDFWVPQLYGLAQLLVAVAKENELYVILDAGELSPSRPALENLLLSIDNVGVLGSEMMSSIDTILAEKRDEWSRYLTEGRLGRILQSIEALPRSSAEEKHFLRIQILHRAGLRGQALQEIENFASRNEPGGFALVKLAHIANESGAELLARRLLMQALDELNEQEALEFALVTAQDIGDVELEDRIVTRFAALFPGANSLRQRDIQRHIASGNYKAAAAAIGDHEEADGVEALYKFLADNIEGTATPDYVAICQRIADLDVTWKRSAWAAVIRDALRRGLIIHALDLALRATGNPRTFSPPVGLMLDILEQLLLQGSAPNIDEKRLNAVVIEVVRYLSEHPTDGSVRIRLTRLLSVDVSGSLGLPLIASVVLDLMQQPLSLLPKRGTPGLPVDELRARKAFLEKAFGWIETESPIVLGRLALPASLLPEPADLLVPPIVELLDYSSGTINNESDFKVVMNWLCLAVSLAPHTSNPDQDLDMIRLTACRLASAGYVQQARDLVEQALQTSVAGPRRKRAAWFVMADVYHRLNNHSESLVALACAAAGDPNVEFEQAFHETNCLVRLLRDLGLYAFARQAHRIAGDLLQQTGLAGANQHRHDFMALQINMAQLLHTPDQIKTTLPNLLARLVANAREVLACDDDPMPAAAMLGQLLRVASKYGVEAPDDANDTLKELVERAGPAGSSLVQALSADSPKAEDVLQLHRRTEAARYSEDVGYDVGNSIIVAQRLLGGDEAATNSDVAIFAIELLSDRAIATPGWESTAKPVPAVSTISEPAEIARAVSTQGVNVVVAGFDEESRLTVVTTEAGRTAELVREEEAVFSKADFRSWTVEFPYRYGIDEGTANLFYLTTERLRLSKLPAGPVLLIADTELQQFPPNLIRLNDEFAGQSRPMAAAPSLSWLATARQPRTTNGQKVAWISIEETRGQALAMIAERLGNTLAEHDIRLDTGPALPGHFTGSRLAIVAAHGSIAPERRYFQRVSDEGSFNVHSADVANALRNVGVVILFVCNAARADKHPRAHTTIGLAKQLLDRGCSAVIASPWPLEVSVPSYWLPKFLEECRSGAAIIDANFQANQSVARTFAGDPARSLAMTVFGDPLLRL